MGYTAGHGAAVLDLGSTGSVLPLICYEVFPQDLQVPRHAGRLILQITNDGWFGNLAGPYQHLAQARLRRSSRACQAMRSPIPAVTAAIDAKGASCNPCPLTPSGSLIPMCQARCPC